MVTTGASVLVILLVQLLASLLFDSPAEQAAREAATTRVAAAAITLLIFTDQYLSNAWITLSVSFIGELWHAARRPRATDVLGSDFLISNVALPTL